jgi:Short C-terminal domain
MPPEPEESEPKSMPSTGGMTSDLERLADLHARGSLTDEEFKRAKARLLGGE